MSGTSLALTLSPPLVLHNALPVPMDLTLRSKWTGAMSLHLDPTEKVAMLHLEASGIESVTLRPEGYQSTLPLSLASMARLPGESDSRGPRVWRASSLEQSQDAVLGGMHSLQQHHNDVGGAGSDAGSREDPGWRFILCSVRIVTSRYDLLCIQLPVATNGESGS